MKFINHCKICKNHFNEAGHMIPEHIKKCLSDGFIVKDEICSFCLKYKK
jgi:hypothetical protein